MLKNLFIALKVSFFTILLTGVVYPFVVTGVSYVLFHKQASGSLIINEQQKAIGSELIGQNFKNPAYFFPRPSAAGYDGLASKGSNLGPTSKELLKKIHEKIEEIKGYNSEPIPIDLVTSSGSGLDPHISPQAAYWQAPRIALQRDLSLGRIYSIIDDLIENPQFIMFGNPRINVLKLNLALDQYFGSEVALP